MKLSKPLSSASDSPIPRERPFFRRPYKSSCRYAVPLLIACSCLGTGCSKKEEASTDTNTIKVAAVTAGAGSLLSHAPQQSFFLAAYNGQSEGGKRSYAESLKSLRSFLNSDKKPATPEEGAKNSEEETSDKAPKKGGKDQIRSFEVVQREIVELLETAGFLPKEPGANPLYREAVVFAASGAGDDLFNGGVCASGPDFPQKLSALIEGARQRKYDVGEETFGASKGYAITTQFETESHDESDTKSSAHGGKGSHERQGKKDEKSDTTTHRTTHKLTMFIGTSPDGLIGASSVADSVTQCLHPKTNTPPPLVETAQIKRLMGRYPDTQDDFLRVYFDLGLVQQALESKRDALEKLIGTPEASNESKPSSSTTCAPDETCSSPKSKAKTQSSGEDEAASRLPSLQDAITSIGALPSRTFLAKSSFEASGKVTSRLMTYLDKDGQQSAAMYKRFDEIAIPKALTSIPTESAILVGLHYPLEKSPLLELLPPESSFASLSTIRSVALAILDLPAGALAPEVGIAIESSAPDKLKALIKGSIDPFLKGGDLPIGSWQSKDIDGAPSTFIITPLGIGLFMAEPSGALLVSTTESGIKKLLASHKNASAEKTQQALQLASGVHSPFAGRVDSAQLAKILQGVQGTMSMFAKDSSMINGAQIEQVRSLGTMYLTLEFNDGFTELVWRKVPSPAVQESGQASAAGK